MLESPENVLGFSTFAFPEGSTNKMDLYHHWTRKSDMSRIHRLYQPYDELQSKWAQPEMKHKQRYKHRKSGRRIWFWIRNLVDEFHKRITKWNCDNWNYNVMCLPKSQTQEMVFKSQRKAYSKTTGNMLTWCHYRFNNRLMNKTRGYPDYIVIICGEVYISKMSTGCGSLHPNLEGAKAFKCPQYN